ncbi:uncharacterized protein SPSK_08156 [Sporothrix schenckii 1099-18]|uniref:Uncharacterized protein n=1 Tax=Sporothrix schenckii 1099-18 TaxID=1397361 RepID=A0A0F2MI96_SPOSC|nr:uncharacterized protein SPSK_08156 [Sporothrix schenckii 1099-18]KJR88555.1 hypothetical protein SPSK_08156 [Sporothrix schenckii 1099-18]
MCSVSFEDKQNTASFVASYPLVQGARITDTDLGVLSTKQQADLGENESRSIAGCGVSYFEVLLRANGKFGGHIPV